MLDLCRDTLRRALATNVELRDRLDKAQADNARLRRYLKQSDNGEA
jgi:hypothetical protein